MKKLSATSKLVAIAAFTTGSAQATAGNGRPSSRTASNSLATESDAVVSDLSSPLQIATPDSRIPWVTSFPRGGGKDDSKDDSNNDKSSKSSKSKKKKKSKKKPKESSDSDKNDIPDSNESDKPKRQTAQSSIIVEEILQQDDFYDILGVAHTASERDITKAYRRRCVQTHPDKTAGDRRAFDKVAEAYDCLSDSQKRSVYNRFGKAGLDGGGAAGSGGGSYQDMFRSMFQQAAQQREQQQRRNQTLRYQLQVTLEDLYQGRTQTVTVSPPNFRHQYASHRRQKQVDVHIPKGSINGQSIVLSGEVDFNDDTPGDLIFVVTEARHPTFTRKGHDLAVEMTIGLEEALCGLQRPILHLNGEELWVESAKSAKGQPLVIQTGDVQVLKGWGMPKRNHNGEFGDLYIQYRVEMPKAKNGSALNDDELHELSRLLTKLQGSNKLQYAKARSRSSKSKSKSNPIADDDDADQEGNDTEEGGEMHRLLDARVSDFGVASGRVEWEDDDGVHGQDHGDDFHPFGAAASGFFGGSGSGSRFYYSSNFGKNDEDGATQCQQM